MAIKQRTQACLLQAAGRHLRPRTAHSSRPAGTARTRVAAALVRCHENLQEGHTAGSTVATRKACATALADQPLPASHLSAAAASTCAARRWRPRRCTTRRSTRAPQSRQTLRQGEAAVDLQRASSSRERRARQLRAAAAAAGLRERRRWGGEQRPSATLMRPPRRGSAAYA